MDLDSSCSVHWRRCWEEPYASRVRVDEADRKEGIEVRHAIRLVAFLWTCAFIASCATSPGERGLSTDSLLGELVAIERSALDRWVQLDPSGYLGLFAPEVTYFDP